MLYFVFTFESSLSVTVLLLYCSYSQYKEDFKQNKSLNKINPSSGCCLFTDNTQELVRVCELGAAPPRAYLYTNIFFLLYCTKHNFLLLLSVAESYLSTVFWFCPSVSAPEATPLKLKSGALLKLSIKQLWGAAFLNTPALDEVWLSDCT